VAVLPLANLSGDPAEDYFADGMTEALTTELAKIGALRVISRTSAEQYKGAAKSLPEIARELNVDAVVEGSVARSGGRVRITVQLIRAATDEHLWAEQYERDVRDVLALEGEMARTIAGEVRLKLTPQEQAQLANARPVDPAAHDAYLKGLYYFNEGRNKLRPPERQEWLERSLEYFGQAVAADPGFAQAHAVYARAYYWLATSTRPELWPRAREEAAAAVELDDNLADAHSSLAFVLSRLYCDRDRAEREYLRAIELNPSLSEAHHAYALLLSTEGRHAEALAEVRRAVELDPLQIPLRRNVGVLLTRAGQYDAAIRDLEGMIAMGPTGPGAHASLAYVYSLKGRHAEALAEARLCTELSENWPSAVAIEAWVNARAGNRKQAAEMLRGLERLPKVNPTAHVNMAQAYVALGDADRAVELLETVYAEDPGALNGLNADIGFEDLASNPRYQDLLRRMCFAP
jgi:TolB-like protein/Tfp pilus assembly protein PilF